MRMQFLLVLLFAFASVFADVLHYKYNENYELIQSSNDTQVINYGYNARSELTHYDDGALRIDWDYDFAGNLRSRSSKTEFRCVTNYFFANALNQYVAISNQQGYVVSLLYDADGNLLRDGRNQYYWDAANRLKAVHSYPFVNGGVLVENSYDPKNRRVVKQVSQLEGFNPSHPASATNGTLRLLYKTYFIYDDLRILFEKRTNADSTTAEIQYVWGRDLSGTLNGADGIGGLLCVKIDGKIYLPAMDAFGNVYAYIDGDNGSSSAVMKYDPFGQILGLSEVVSDQFHIWFSTKYYDREVGLYYFGNRFYSPFLNRWINRDPIGEDGGENLYRFVDNNPYRNVDPDGHIPLDTIWDLGNIAYDIYVGDEVALAADIAALMIPYAPAGATKLVKAAKLKDVKRICGNPKEIGVTYQYMKASDYKGGRHTLPKSAAQTGWVRRTGGSGGGNRPSSRFMPGWNDVEIKALIGDAFQAAKQQGKVSPKDLDGFIYDTGKTVGASNGKLTTKIKIHVNRDGTGLHAFPFSSK